MHFYVLTLFPEMVEMGCNTSILGRACQKGLLSVEAVNIRDYTRDKHNKVDDYPYGGGAGMLMQAQPVYDAYCALRRRIAGDEQTQDLRVVYATPQGQVFSQEKAKELALEENLVFLCGHYEGIDERVLEEIVTDRISIGDYVLTGGELPVMVMIDAISRMVPGVLANQESGEFESFHENLLEYPQYTRPENWRGKRVPGVLLSGNHAKVEAWRLECSREITRRQRPDLYEKYDLANRALAWLSADKVHHMDMIEDIRRQKARVTAVLEEGVLLQDLDTGIYMVSAKTKDAGERLLSLVNQKNGGIACHQDFLAQSVVQRWGLRCEMSCYQAVYTKKTPLPEVEGISILPLDESDWELVAGHYDKIEVDDIKKTLQESRLFGAFLEEKPVGFIGEHKEGGMGMLEVFTPYRRRGIAMALESWFINRTLEKGRLPFGQIETDNEASLGLQKKLGLRLSREKIYWFFPKS